MKPNPIAATLVATLISLSSSGLAFAQSETTTAVAKADRGPIEVVVWNIRRGLGHVRVAICTRFTFANAQKTCPYHGEAPTEVGTTTVIVPDVPAGSYAAEVFQDDDDRGAIKRGPLGIPMEGVGFSNDAPIGLTPPRFKDAAFDYDPSAPLALRIKLRYFPNL
jgi:uncharacterized protein (DUF2141 family)